MPSALVCAPPGPSGPFTTDRLSSTPRHRLPRRLTLLQAQSTATVPTFTGDGGPILSLIGEQHTEYTLFWGDDFNGCSRSPLFRDEPIGLMNSIYR